MGSSELPFESFRPNVFNVQKNDCNSVEYLLKNGASVHARDRNDATPLIDAIREGHNEVRFNVFFSEQMNWGYFA